MLLRIGDMITASCTPGRGVAGDQQWSNSMSMQQPANADRVQAGVTQAVREHATFFMIEGIVLIILGFLAIALPPFATLAVTLILGWIFLASGIMGLIMTFGARGAPGFWWSLVSALLAVAAGLVLLVSPVRGAVSLTLLLIAFFVIEGIVSIMYALEHRQQLSGRWEWMLISGIVDLLLAGMIFTGLPGSAAWALGLLVGINMIFGGTALVMMARHARGSA
jgi:uncharacterized membrane protein HdeD (DUF308 family)